MKCQNWFSGKNKKNISVYPLLKILPRVLSVNSVDLLTWIKKVRNLQLILLLI